jgi:hypothetical protein
MKKLEATLSTLNAEFLAAEALKSGLSENGAVNVLLAELRVLRTVKAQPFINLSRALFFIKGYCAAASESKAEHVPDYYRKEFKYLHDKASEALDAEARA